MLTYTQRGEGRRPILLLHGFLGSGRNLGGLARQWERVEPDVRIIMPDLPGHGRSPSLDNTEATLQMATAIREFGQQVSAGPPFEVVGHSMGGRVGLRLHELDPPSLRSLVLLDVSPSPIAERAEAEIEEILRALLQAPSTSRNRTEMRELLAQNSSLTEARIDWLLMNLDCNQKHCVWRVDRERLRKARRDARGVELWPRQVTSLRFGCVFGSQSSFVSKTDRSRLETLGAKVTKIEGAGHFLHVERTAQVVEAIRTILGP